MGVFFVYYLVLGHSAVWGYLLFLLCFLCMNSETDSFCVFKGRLALGVFIIRGIYLFIFSSYGVFMGLGLFSIQ